jgi:predicted MFS family arabinose efflux permease
MTAIPSNRLVVPILSATNFIVGVGAFVVVGLLNPLAEDLSMTTQRAGLIMVIYAMAYAVLSPVLVAVTGRLGRRRLLAAALIVFALSNLVAALATTEMVMFVSRVIAAAGAGILTPVSATVAAGLSPPEGRARALAAVFFGMTLAQVMGVPVGSFIAYTFGWRMAFGAVVVLSLPCLWLIWTRVPAGLSFTPVRLSDLMRTLGNAAHMVAVFFTSMFLGSIYVIYTYVAPLMDSTMGYGRDGISAVLLVFGIGAVVGNIIGGRITDWIGPFRTLLILSSGQVVIMPMFSTLPMSDLSLFVLCLAWASFGWAFMAAQQVRLISLDPENAPVLLSLNAAAIYVGAAVGSAVGGVALDQFGLTALGITGGLGAACAVAVLLLGQRLNARAR